MDGQMFERRFVEYALDLARKQNMNQLDFAKAIWPLKSEASATTTIIALKRHNSRGKPQNLRVSDAIKMAEILGKEYPSMCFEVWEMIKMEISSHVPPRRTQLRQEKPETPDPVPLRRATGAIGSGAANKG